MPKEVKENTMTRREAREQAFFVLFEKIFDKESTISEIISKAKEAELIKLNGFAELTLKNVEDNLEAIDALIIENSEKWSIERLPKVSLAILRLAIGEIKYCEDVPAGVAVNEAVELSKKYGTEADAAFVNGLLGTIVKL